MNMIPGIALSRVEILRDGASAQYGADAVAGVFNLQLRKNSRGVHVRMQGGGVLRGRWPTWDGWSECRFTSYGERVCEPQFLSIGMLSRRSGAVCARMRQSCSSAVIQCGDPAQVWGSPKVSNSIVGFLNTGIDVGSAHVYAFGGYGQRESEGGFYFRAPGTGSARSSVFRFGSGG